MPLALPEPSTEKLEHSPLSLVVCQVRHEENIAVSEPKLAFRVHEAVSARYPILEQQAGQELSITAGPLGVQTMPGAAQRGWKMRSEDERWNVVVMPSFFSLETTEYDDWADFRGRLEDLTRAVTMAVDPSLEQRIGLRFIDRITHPDVASPQDWIGWIDPAFLGPIAHARVGEGVTTSQQIIQLETGDGRSLILRHGAVRDQEAGNRWMYLIDQDCFVERGRPFDPDQVLEVTESLHTLALQMFQEAITPALYKHLSGGQ